MRRFHSPVTALALGIALAHILVNMLTPYGVHRDEFLYMAMGRHLRLWQMDFPPMIAMLSELSRWFGDSLAAIRIAPAIAVSCMVMLAARFARELGGGRGAETLAALAVIANPLFLRAGNLFQPVVFDQLWWTLGLYALMRIAQSEVGSAEQRRWWILFGLIGGLGLLTKFSIAFFAVGAFVAIVTTPLRRSLATPWPWLAALIALVVGSPSVVGQIALDFPVLGQLHDLRSTQLQRVGAADFVLGQLLLGPGVILAAIGLAGLLRSPRLRDGRVAGIAAATAFVVLLLLRGKSYYIGPIYPALFGAGAAMLVPASRASSGRQRSLYWLVAAGITLYAVVTLPFGLPILAPPLMARYAHAMGMTEAVRTNTGDVLSLPQDYADMLGWPAQTEAVVRAYAALPAADRERVVLGAGNYGQAGALDFYGSRVGLPPVISSAGSYWFFGPGARRGDVMLVLAKRDSGKDLATLFERCDIAESVRSPEHEWLVEEERDVVVFRCSRPRMSLQAAWPGLAEQH